MSVVWAIGPRLLSYNDLVVMEQIYGIKSRTIDNVGYAYEVVAVIGYTVLVYH